MTEEDSAGWLAGSMSKGATWERVVHLYCFPLPLVCMCNTYPILAFSKTPTIAFVAKLRDGIVHSNPQSATCPKRQ